MVGGRLPFRQRSGPNGRPAIDREEGARDTAALASGARDVLGVVLAGGRSRRFGGGDKCLVSLAGSTMLGRIVARMRPQVVRLLLSANGTPRRFAAFGLPVAADPLPGHPGPLAGILAGLEWAAAHAPECRWVASVPADAPFLPSDLVLRLMTAVRANDGAAACARSAGRLHPIVGLWSVTLAPALRTAMVRDGLRAVGEWARLCRASVVDFPSGGTADPFFNVNRPEDAARARALIEGGGGA